jgi:hypothetical protein
VNLEKDCRGVPATAAPDFIQGHMRTVLAIVFEEKEGAIFSEGALKVAERAQAVLFQPNWKRVFEPQAVVRLSARSRARKETVEPDGLVLCMKGALLREVPWWIIVLP